MNPAYIAPILTGFGLVGNIVWSVFNARMETKVLAHIDGLKGWADEQFVRRRELEAWMNVTPRTA